MAKKKGRMPIRRKGASEGAKKKKKNMGSAVNKIDIKGVAKKQQRAKIVAAHAHDQRVRQEHKEDTAPTTERTKARASTTGRTRSQRSTTNYLRELSTPESRKQLYTRGIGSFKSGGTTTLSHYGSAPNVAPHITSPTLPDRAGSGAGRAAPRYEGTPNTLETRSETVPAPQRHHDPERHRDVNPDKYRRSGK